MTQYFRKILSSLILIGFASTMPAQDAVITIDTSKDRKQVSPYIYGRNNNFAQSFGTNTASEAEIALAKEAGLRIARENGGNNSTKYNWRRKISSHPDWYNNVYDRNWDAISRSATSQLPDIQMMWAFQLIGKVASNKNNNFNDWGYNQSQWWSGCTQNLAGGGTVNSAGGRKATKDGNPNLYTMNWPTDSTTAILKYWFDEGGLGLNKTNFRYWNLDNEPELWNSTHDDVMPTLPSASDFINQYFAVAKKARALYPDIKLCGPVTANEWQWYKWGNETINEDGKYYCWLEYFIMRVAKEQKLSGIRLLDVLDIHWYPAETSNTDILQLHRLFFDKNYIYPGANGLRTINGGWDTSQNKEYIFHRINTWLTQYFGENHGIGLGLSEFGTETNNANINSVLYASMLGTFANNGVELFTPWTWKTGMWETLHLFSHYAQDQSVSSASTNENIVSAYATINNQTDSLTVIVVNRDINQPKNILVNIVNFQISDGTNISYQISGLPSNETFVSHTDNALKSGLVTTTNNSLSITVPALSTTAIILKSKTSAVGHTSYNQTISMHLNSDCKQLTVIYDPRYGGNPNFEIFDLKGQLIARQTEKPKIGSIIELDTSTLPNGIYILRIKNCEQSFSERFRINR